MRQTPSKKVWSAIETALHEQRMLKKDLAKRIGVHVNTITRDSNEPEHIPLERLWLYFDALGIPADDIVKYISSVDNKFIA